MERIDLMTREDLRDSIAQYNIVAAPFLKRMCDVYARSTVTYIVDPKNLELSQTIYPRETVEAISQIRKELEHAVQEQCGKWVASKVFGSRISW